MTAADCFGDYQFSGVLSSEVLLTPARFGVGLLVVLMLYRLLPKEGCCSSKVFSSACDLLAASSLLSNLVVFLLEELVRFGW